MNLGLLAPGAVLRCSLQIFNLNLRLLAVCVCLLPPSHKAVADKGKQVGILAYFERKVKKKMSEKFTGEVAEVEESEGYLVKREG